MINQRMLNQFMKQMKVEDINAKRVIIEQSDNRKIIIENPKVVKMGLQGQESFNVSGDVKFEENEEKYTEEDINLVMEKTKKSKSEVINALEETKGDIAEAILKLIGG